LLRQLRHDHFQLPPAGVATQLGGHGCAFAHRLLERLQCTSGHACAITRVRAVSAQSVFEARLKGSRRLEERSFWHQIRKATSGYRSACASFDECPTYKLPKHIRPL
jgi:hypothetical protein